MTYMVVIMNGLSKQLTTILALDEEDILDMLMEFTRDEAHSVLFSSHIADDLEKVCDYVTFLHGGKVLLSEEKDALLERYGVLNC